MCHVRLTVLQTVAASVPLSAEADTCTGRKYPKQSRRPHLQTQNPRTTGGTKHGKEPTSTRGAGLSVHQGSCSQLPTSSVGLRLSCPPAAKNTHKGGPSATQRFSKEKILSPKASYPEAVEMHSSPRPKDSFLANHTSMLNRTPPSLCRGLGRQG